MRFIGSLHYSVEKPDEETFDQRAYDKYSVREYKTGLAVYSMWSHFLAVVKNDQNFSERSTELFNEHTSKPRLTVFVQLSNSVKI